MIYGGSDTLTALPLLPLWLALFALVSAGNVSTFYYILLIVPIILTIIPYFLFSLFLSHIHEKTEYKKTAIFVFLVLLIIFLGFFLYKYQSSYNGYNSAKSPEDCENKWNKLIDGFEVNQCYRLLAEYTKNVTICDKIKITDTTDPRAGKRIDPSTGEIKIDYEDFKWFCYEDVAHQEIAVPRTEGDTERAISICKLIPGDRNRRMYCLDFVRANANPHNP